MYHLVEKLIAEKNFLCFQTGKYAMFSNSLLIVKNTAFEPDTEAVIPAIWYKLGNYKTSWPHSKVIARFVGSPGQQLMVIVKFSTLSGN